MSDEIQDRMVESRLAELRSAMAAVEAPKHVKPAVLTAFRSAQARRKVLVYRWAAAAAAAAAVAAVLYLSARLPGKTVQVAVPKVEAPKIAVHPEPTEPVGRQPVVTAQKRVPRTRRKAASQAVASNPVQVRREFSTEFIALPYAPPIDASEDAQVVRVRLPRSAMRSLGLPVNEDRWLERVPADVLLGQGGVARAVRFVKVAQ